MAARALISVLLVAMVRERRRFPRRHVGLVDRQHQHAEIRRDPAERIVRSNKCAPTRRSGRPDAKEEA